MIRFLTVVGARPQFIKASALSRAIKNKFSDKISEIILHTGQHYDENMSNVFFEEMQIPSPAYNLNIGSGSHAEQTAAIMTGVEKILLGEKPDYCVVFGDTNSTLAASVAAAKVHIPVIHIEAGLRSFNRKMPEEINRLVCDHVASYLFAPTETSLKNLVNEGFDSSAKPPYSADNPCVRLSGDIMYDNTLFFSELAEKKSQVLTKYELKSGQYVLATIHRDFNTDQTDRLLSILKALHKISYDDNIKVIIPLHPRTDKVVKNNFSEADQKEMLHNPNMIFVSPMSFLDITMLEKHALMIMTDSGGVQKDAYYFKKPCAIFRNETEWTEIIEHGAGILTDVDENRIRNAYHFFKQEHNIEFENIFGDGHSAEYICNEILKYHRT